MVKKSRIMTLVVAAAVLAVVASGSAFAQDCYSGTDTSQVNDGGFCSWTDTASGSPIVSSGTLVEWRNSLSNKDSTYPRVPYNPQVQYWDTTRSQTITVSKGSSMNYNDPAWTPLVGNTQTSNGAYTGIIHIYNYDGGATGISKTGNQHSWTV